MQRPGASDSVNGLAPFEIVLPITDELSLSHAKSQDGRRSAAVVRRELQSVVKLVDAFAYLDDDWSVIRVRFLKLTNGVPRVATLKKARPSVYRSSLNSPDHSSEPLDGDVKFGETDSKSIPFKARRSGSRNQKNQNNTPIRYLSL